MSTLSIINLFVGVLSFISAGSIIYTLLKDKEGKTPIFIAFVLTICTGNIVTGLYRLTQAIGYQGKDLLSKILSGIYPINDLLLIITGLLLSYMISAYHFGDTKSENKK